MLSTGAIEQFETNIPGAYGFRIMSELDRNDMERMAETMNTNFDRMDSVDMLLSFQCDEGAEPGAGLSFEVLKSQFRSLSKVRNYCVVQAPGNADSVIAFFDKLLPVNARNFSSEHNALEHLRSQPELQTSR